MTKKGNHAIDVILNNTVPIKLEESKKALNTLFNEILKGDKK